MLATMDDVAGEFSQAKGEFATEIEKSADEDEEATEEEEHAAEFAKGIHEWIVAELNAPKLEQTKRDSSATQAGAARTPEKVGLLRPE